MYKPDITPNFEERSHLALEKISDHVLIPKHEIVPEESINEVLERFGVSREQLPQISRTDPVLEDIGAKRGDIIRISRGSLTAGKTVFFRIVE